jgi:hypothetical protein
MFLSPARWGEILSQMTIQLLQATVDFLTWVAARSATYSEALEVWQTSCPRSSVWEDSFIDGLVAFEKRDGHDEPVVVVTDKGRAILASG